MGSHGSLTDKSEGCRMTVLRADNIFLIKLFQKVQKLAVYLHRVILFLIDCFIAEINVCVAGFFRLQYLGLSQHSFT